MDPEHQSSPCGSRQLKNFDLYFRFIDPRLMAELSALAGGGYVRSQYLILIMMASIMDENADSQRFPTPG